MFNTEAKWGLNLSQFLVLQATFNTSTFYKAAADKPLVPSELVEAVDLGIREDTSKPEGFVRVFEVRGGKDTGGQTFLRFSVTASDDAIQSYFQKKSIRVVEEFSISA